MNNKMRLYSHILTVDRGLAPNPFWGYCTMAVCAPNHMGIKVHNGDWIIGFSSVARGNRLIYAMQLSLEPLPFKTYFHDPRFINKRPNIEGDWKERCGDNMYYKGEDGNWKQHPTLFHTDQPTIDQDLKHPYVFISEHFYYFGADAVEIPDVYKDLILKRQGCKYNFPSELVKAFVDWLKSNYQLGIHSDPLDKGDLENCDCQPKKRKRCNC
jgi:hypothetical protein